MQTQTATYTPAHLLASVIQLIIKGVGNLFKNSTSTVLARRKTVSICLAILCMTSVLSLAQVGVSNVPGVASTGELDQSNNTSVEKPTVPSLSPGLRDKVVGVGDAIQAKLDSLVASNPLQKVGFEILGLGLAIQLLWTGVKTLMSGKGLSELLGEWIPIMISAGVILAFIAPDSKSPNMNPLLGIDSLMNNVASSISSAVGAGNSELKVDTVPNVVKTAFNVTFTVIGDMIKTVSHTGSFDAIGFLPGLFMLLLHALAIVISMFFILGAMCAYMANAIMSIISIKLILALTPVMVPFLIFPPTTWIFDSWIRFFLGAGMLKIVGAFMLGLTSGMFNTLKTLSQQINLDSQTSNLDTFGGDFVLFGAMIFVSLLAGLLMSQVPGIAGGLLGSAGGAGFKGISALEKSVGGRAMKGTANAAREGASGFIQRRAAAGQAVKDVISGRVGGRDYSNKRAQRMYNQAASEAKGVQDALGSKQSGPESRQAPITISRS
jgi:type IV secretion system protein TrbL